MKNRPLLFILTFFLINLVACQQESSTPSSILDEIAVSWKLESNIIGDKEGHRAAFTIKNNSDEALDADWTLHFNMTPRVIREAKTDGPATIEWINGDFYSFRPKEGFRLQAGEEVTVTYEADYWIIKKSDAPVGLYFAKGTEENVQTFVVQDYEVAPFLTKEQTSRFKRDQAIVPTARTRYEENQQLDTLSKEDVLPIIPSPKRIVQQAGTFTVGGNGTIKVAFNDELSQEVKYLKDLFLYVYSGKVERLKEGETGPATIKLTLKDGLAEEAYDLNINDRQIEIVASTPTGIFYGIQSLYALITPEAYSQKPKQLEFPLVQIQDEPRFAYRGLHVDVARNFQSKASVKKIIDVMALYKLNKLHLHLTDDEGWRLELESFPELTSVGSKRGHTLSEDSFLQPAYGSGPDPEGASAGNGYYTRSEFIEMIQYANNRHIEVIPELNLPGHARAAIKAMEARYRRLMEEGKKVEAEEYLLTDFEDRSDYLSAQFYTDNTVCVCKESVYQFYEKAVDEVIEIFKIAEVPLRTIHTGGDEVPAGVWEASPVCAELIAREATLESAADLQNYFIGRISKLLSDRGLVTGGWEEIVMQKLPEGGWKPNVNYLDRKMLPYVWQNLWGNQDLGYRLANAGYPVVLCNVTNFYFDLAYDKDPEEKGLYWGGLVNTKKAFEFIPFDMFKSTKVDPLDIPFDEETDFKGMERLKTSAIKNIIGVQGELWSEALREPGMIEYALLPKMFGLAERAWAKPSAWESTTDFEARNTAIDEEWNDFANTLGQKELKRLDQLFGTYNYRIPLPGAIVEDGQLKANIAFPGFEIRYTTDGTEPTTQSPLYEGPIALGEKEIRLKAFDTQGRGSRTSIVKEEEWIKN